jgi:putrescine aminotransferase
MNQADNGTSASGPEPDGYAGRVEGIARHVNGPYVQFLHRLGLDFEAVRAEGASVYDDAGRRYVDCVAGYGNLNVGHNHPHVIEAVVAELRSPRPFNLPFLSAAQARLAEMLAQVTPGDLECSFIVNSGSEAVDSALKLARLATGRREILTTRGAWHGFTFGAMSVSEPSMLRSFEPLVPGVTALPYGDAAAVEAAITDQTAAVIVEPIQSESGAIVPPAGYLRQLCDLCQQRNVVLIFDEVKCGLGKAGTLWACNREAAVPDILLAGKSLGGGAMPIGTLTARRKLWGRFGFSFPMSSSSGAGNAPACAAAVATLEVIERERLPEKAARSGARFVRLLQQLAADYPQVVRGFSGAGLLLALHTDGPRTSNAIVQGCVQRGVLVMAAFCDRSRVLIEPPLSISDAEIDIVLSALTETVRELAAPAR